MVSLVSLSSKTGVDILETVSKGFVAEDLFEHLPYTSSYSPFKYFSRSEGVWCGPATVLQTVEGGSHAETCWSLWWDVPSTLESYVNCLTFIDFFFPLTLTNNFFFSFSFPDFYLFIDTFVYHLIFFLNWLVNAAVIAVVLLLRVVLFALHNFIFTLLSTFQFRRCLVWTSHVQQLLCYRLWMMEAML